MFDSLKKLFLKKDPVDYQTMKEGIDLAIAKSKVFERTWDAKRYMGLLEHFQQIVPENSNFDVKNKNGEHIFKYVLSIENKFAETENKLEFKCRLLTTFLSACFLEKMKDFSIISQDEKNKLLIENLRFPRTALNLLKNGADAQHVINIDLLNGIDIQHLPDQEDKNYGVLDGCFMNLLDYNISQIKEVLSYKPPVTYFIEKLIKNIDNEDHFINDKYFKSCHQLLLCVKRDFYNNHFRLQELNILQGYVQNIIFNKPNNNSNVVKKMHLL